MERKFIFLTPATYQDKLILRFLACSQSTAQTDVDFAWTEIITAANIISSQNLYNNLYNGNSVDFDNLKQPKIPNIIEILSKFDFNCS